MKRSLVFIVFLSFLIGMSAQRLIFLKGEKRVSVEIDFSETLFNGLTFDELAEVEPYWIDDQSEIYSKFLSEFNSKMKSPIGIKAKTADYQVVVYPLTFTRKGTNTSYFIVKDKAGVIFRSKEFESKGGHIGTFVNLIGDGMESLGKNVAKQIKKEMKF